MPRAIFTRLHQDSYTDNICCIVVMAFMGALSFLGAVDIRRMRDLNPGVRQERRKQETEELHRYGLDRAKELQYHIKRTLYGYLTISTV